MLSRIKRMLFKRQNRSPSKSIIQQQDATTRHNIDPGELLGLLQPLVEKRSEGAVLFSAWTSMLPPEIMYQIIDKELITNMPALQNLARTCRLLNQHVRRYIFKRISLQVSTPSSNLLDFLSLIQRSPDVLRWIKQLFLEIHYNSATTHQQKMVDIDCMHFIIKQQYPNLYELQLNFNTAGSPILKSPKLSSALIELLNGHRLSKVVLRGTESFGMSLCHYLGHVVQFTVQNVNLPVGDGSNGDTNNDLSDAPPSCPKMRPSSLTVFDPFVGSVVLNSVYCDLSGVSNFFFYGSQMHFISRYLDILPLTLTRLQSYWDPGAITSLHLGDVEAPPRLDLSRLSKLQHLTLTSHVIFADDNPTYNSNLRFHWLINTLLTLPSPCTMESIHFIIGCNFLHLCNTLDWSLFDTTVFGASVPAERWATLRSLQMTFYIPHHIEVNSMMAEFKEVWLPERLQNFRERTIAQLVVDFETRKESSHFLQK